MASSGLRFWTRPIRGRRVTLYFIASVTGLLLVAIAWPRNAETRISLSGRNEVPTDLGVQAETAYHAEGGGGAASPTESRPTDDPPASGSVQPVPPPSVAAQRPRYAVVSHSQVGGEGQVIALAVVSPPGRSFSYGVRAAVESWTGDEWRRIGTASTSLTSWTYRGRFAASDVGLRAPLIQFVASEAESGPLEWFTVPGLEPGWHRLNRSIDGISQTAPFEVLSDSGLVGPDLQDESTPGELMDLRPALSAAGGEVLAIPFGGPGLSPQYATLQQFGSGGWRAVHSVQVSIPESPSASPFEGVLKLPDVASGMYRVVAIDAAGAERRGYLFVGA